jgi:serine/threonine-protein kinase
MAEDKPSDLPTRIGKYVILGYIATGGMAELFLGRDPTTHEPVVIKRILPHLARQTSFVSMFIDEARIGLMVRHPNLVEHLELGQIGSELFLVMEYLEGESLSGLMRRLVSRGERLDFGLVAHIVAQACLGLHAAHALTDDHDKPLHIVHRDVSPSNIFVTYEGKVKVLDFGIATAVHRLTHTATGQIKGKFSYMSPEQCRSKHVDHRSDLFSLGIVLYELSVLKRLFKRDNELLVLEAVCEDAISRPTKECHDYPQVLEDICMRALSRDRDRRQASAKQLHGELIAAMSAVGYRSDPHVSLKYEMRRLFADRMAEKDALVAHVRGGTDVGELPAAEVDEAVEVPDATFGAPTSVRALSEAPTTAQRRSKRWFRYAVAAAAVLALAEVVTWLYVGRDSGTAPTTRPAIAAPPAVAARPAPSPTPPQATPPTAAPAPAPPQPTAVEITIESHPQGEVFIDGRAFGPSPVTAHLTGTTARVEVRRSGYATAKQDVALDRDHGLVFALTPASHPTEAAKAKREPQAEDTFHRFD